VGPEARESRIPHFHALTSIAGEREHLTFAAKLEIGVRSQESGARRKEEEGRRKEPEEVFLQI
jgi:hypothetical protein